jgi:hypothetical protein
MPAQNPQGAQKYWFNGLPFVGVKNSAAATGAQKIWFNGLPAEALFPAEAGGGAAGNVSFEFLGVTPWPGARG